jgi:nicotinate-nucleotide adenylyltransferase
LRTIETLKDANPGVDLAVVIGADLVEESATWHGAEELRRLVPFIVVGRTGRTAPPSPEAPPSAPDGVTPIAIPDVSSTAIRAALGAGRPVSAWVPRSVLAYIFEHRLYGASGTG